MQGQFVVSLGHLVAHVGAEGHFLPVHLDLGVCPLGKVPGRFDPTIVVEGNDPQVIQAILAGQAHHVWEPHLVVEINHRQVVLAGHRFDLAGGRGRGKVVNVEQAHIHHRHHCLAVGIHHRLNDKALQLSVDQQVVVPVDDAPLAEFMTPHEGILAVTRSSQHLDAIQRRHDHGAELVGVLPFYVEALETGEQVADKVYPGVDINIARLLPVADAEHFPQRGVPGPRQHRQPTTIRHVLFDFKRLLLTETPDTLRGHHYRRVWAQVIEI